MMVVDDIVINKSSSLEQCLKRVKDEYRDDPANLQNQTKQDAIVLNLQRACELAIDLAMHVICVKDLAVPQTSRDAFDLLEEAGVLSPTLSSRMKSMVGFRNIAVHQYEKLNLAVIKNIIENTSVPLTWE